MQCCEDLLLRFLLRVYFFFFYHFSSYIYVYDHFGVNFCVWCKESVQFFSFAYGCPVVTHYFSKLLFFWELFEYWCGLNSIYICGFANTWSNTFIHSINAYRASTLCQACLSYNNTVIKQDSCLNVTDILVRYIYANKYSLYYSCDKYYTEKKKSRRVEKM